MVLSISIGRLIGAAVPETLQVFQGNTAPPGAVLRINTYPQRYVATSQESQAVSRKGPRAEVVPWWTFRGLLRRLLPGSLSRSVPGLLGNFSQRRGTVATGEPGAIVCRDGVTSLRLPWW